MLAPLASSSSRAGRWQPQPEGYSAFVPRPLPPDPPLEFHAALRTRLSEADQALGRLDGSIETLPDADLFLMTYIRQEAVLSSQIEGTQSSLEDLLAAEARVLTPDRPDDVDEVVNYVAAMRDGLEAIRDRPISIDLIKAMHRRLLEGTRGAEKTPGERRETQVWIGPRGCGIHEATFVPPPPNLVDPALEALEAYLQADSPEIPPLVRVALAHAQFETIHPFRDGNGRLGRLLITLLLCRDGILTKPVLYLSWFFKRHRTEYYERLQAVRDDGRWEEWVAFFLQAVAEVSASAVRTTRSILALRERHRALISDRLGAVAGNGHRVLESLFTAPFITVAGVRSVIGTTFQPANTLVARLVEVGILEERSGRRRNRVFAYGAYLRIFAEGPGAIG